MKEEYGFDMFLESSAKTGFNAKEIFVEAAKLLYKDYQLYSKVKLYLFFTLQKLEKENININDIISQDEQIKKKCC